MKSNLSEALLQSSSISSAVEKPDYDRDSLRGRIVHFGVGGFHRSHQAEYTHDLLSRKRGSDWGILGIGVREADGAMKKVLDEQNYLYTLVSRSQSGMKARILAPHIGFLHAYPDTRVAVELLTNPEVEVVTLTITEPAYPLLPGTDKLNENDPLVQKDKASPARPSSVFGILLQALKLRMERGLKPFTVLSCDNIQGNGHVTKEVMIGLAGSLNDKLQNWVEANVPFPNCMVDRITPATTDVERSFVEKEFGYTDQWPVFCESFRQWIIEDQFSGARPEWELVGAQFTEDVAPYEKMKLRLLNAGHSSLGYLGYLAGFRTIDEITRDPEFGRYLSEFMAEEVTPFLDEVPGVDLAEYRQSLVDRFSNHFLQDQALRICLDGSGKIPKFVLPSLRDQLANNHEIARTALIVASWFRFLSGEDEQGEAIPIEDPIAKELHSRAKEGGKDPSLLLEMEEIFDPELRKSERLKKVLSSQLSSLYELGSRKTLQRLLDGDFFA